MKKKKLICIILSIALITSVLFFGNTFEATANDKLNGVYVGTYSDSFPMEFEIESVDLDAGTFEGHVITGVF